MPRYGVPTGPWGTRFIRRVLFPRRVSLCGKSLSKDELSGFAGLVVVPSAPLCPTYGFALDVADENFVTALGQAQQKHRRPSELSELEISVTPPGFDVPDKAMREAYAAAGVHPLVLRPRPDMDAAALERFAAETGRAVGA